jgi:hypothetical protein
MNATRSSRPKSDDGAASPGSPPQTTPIVYPRSDHSFTLQTIMELQRAVGSLDATLKSVKESVDRMDGRLASVEEKLSGVTHKIYAAGVVLAILVAIGGFVVNKASDVAIASLTAISQPTAATKDKPPVPPNPGN